MKLAPFISGVFGTTGFGLSVLAGVATGNPVETVLTRGLMYGVVCYAVGFGVGLVAQQIALEHAKHISQTVAAEDAAAETQRLEDEAARAAENAGNETLPTSAPASTTSAAR